MRRLLGLLGLALLLSGCAAQKAVTGPALEPLTLMGQAMSAHLQGDWATSNARIEACLGILAKRPNIKLGEEAGALLFTKDLKGRSGDPEELVFLHSLGMLNYAMLGQVDEALVEARRSDEVQRWMVDQGKAVGDDPLGRLISAWLYREQGHDDDALIDLKRAHAAYVAAGKSQKEPSFLAGDIAALESTSARRPKDQGDGEVWVLIYSGILQVDGGKVSARERLDQGNVHSDKGPSAELEQVQDLVPLMERALDARKGGDFIRSFSQVAMRSAIIVTLAMLTRGELPGNGGADFVARAAQRDDRHWDNLPANIHAARLRLKPGLQNLVIDSVVGGVDVRTRAMVRVRKGRRALVQASYQGVDYQLRLSPSLKP